MSSFKNYKNIINVLSAIWVTRTLWIFGANSELWTMTVCINPKNPYSEVNSNIKSYNIFFLNRLTEGHAQYCWCKRNIVMMDERRSVGAVDSKRDKVPWWCLLERSLILTLQSLPVSSTCNGLLQKFELQWIKTWFHHTLLPYYSFSLSSECLLSLLCTIIRNRYNVIKKNE